MSSGATVWPKVLKRLALARGAVVTHEALAFAAYGDDPNGGPGFAEDVLRGLICKLRKRLPPGVLTNVWGVGYRLDPDCEMARLFRELDDAHVVLARSPADEAAFRALQAGPGLPWQENTSGCVSPGGV